MGKDGKTVNSNKMCEIVKGLKDEKRIRFECFFNIKKKEEVIRMTETQENIKEIIEEVKDLLLRKNKQYGNSALEPMGIFAKGSAEELIRVRIDDKLNRLLQGDDSIETDEDIILDLIGYLVLLLISMRCYN